MDIQTWLATLLSERPFGNELEPPVLLAADADRVSEYVFETPGLPEMRGASMQLDQLNEKGIRKLFVEAGLSPAFVNDDPPGCLVYAAGGSLLALVPESKADNLRKEIEKLYPKQTGAATITCVTVPVKPKDIHEHFGDLVVRAGAKLRIAKRQKIRRPFFEMLPFVRRCDACRNRPATEFISYDDEPPEARCRVCAGKRRNGWKHRSVWHQKLGVEGAPKDLEEVADPSDVYLGVIYADGNNLGEWFQEADTFEEYRERSRFVIEAVHKALEHALRKRCVSKGHPFEVILVGGDDVLLIVPASDALPVAHAICQSFEDEMSDDQRTMSAGVVIADHHTPVYFLRRLAKDLLKNAKQDARGSTIDFLVLKGQGTRSAEQARERITLGPETLILNHGPYTLDDLQQLIDHVRLGKQSGFSRSQLHALRASLQQGRQASALTFLYQQARTGDKAAAFLDAFAEAWSDEAHETPPWREARILRGGAREYRTPWADLVDVWDFVE